MEDILLKRKTEPLTLTIPKELEEIILEYAQTHGLSKAAVTRIALGKFFKSELAKKASSFAKGE